MPKRRNKSDDQSKSHLNDKAVVAIRLRMVKNPHKYTIKTPFSRKISCILHGIGVQFKNDSFSKANDKKFGVTSFTRVNVPLSNDHLGIENSLENISVRNSTKPLKISNYLSQDLT